MATDNIELAVIFKRDPATGRFISGVTVDANKMGQSFKKAADEGTKGFKALGYQITFVAWHIRFLGNVLDNVGKQFTRVISDWIKTGSELQDRFFGLQTSAALYGFSADDALQKSRDLATKGLVPLTTSAQAMSNIMLTGAFNVDQASDFMTRYLDVATLVTGGQAEMAKSLEFFTESVLRGTMVLGTDVTARAIWNITNQRVNKELGVTLQKLGAQRRILEIQKTLYKNFNDILGLHEVRMALVGANLTKMTESYQYLKYELTLALWPAIKLISEGVVKFVSIIGALVKQFSSLFSVFIVTNVITLILLGSFLTLLGTLLSVVKVISWATVTTETYSWALTRNYYAGLLTAKGYLFQATALKILGFALRWSIPLFFLFELLLMGVTYGLLKLTGATNVQSEASEKMKKVFQELGDLVRNESGLFDTAADSQKEANEKKALSHRRTVEDLEEDLERERSKGLWADQLKIKDFEKRLARENEDWASSLAKQAALSTIGAKKEETALEKKVREFGESMAKMKKINDETIELMRWQWFTLIEDLTSEEFWKTWWEKVPGKIYNTFIKLAEEIYDILIETDWIKVGKQIGTWIANYVKIAFKEAWDLANDIYSWLKKTDWAKIGEQIGTWITEDLKDWILKTNWWKVGGDISYILRGGFLAEMAIGIGKTMWSDLFKDVNWTKIGADIADLLHGGFLKRIILKIITTGWSEIFKNISWIQTGVDIGNKIGTGIINGIIWFFWSSPMFLTSTLYEKGREWGQAILNGIKSFFWDNPRAIIDAIQSSLPQFQFPSLFPSFRLPFRQTGHLQVPGKLGQPIPTILHGGETIIPAHESTATSSTVINIYNPVIRNDNDLTRLADLIEERLGLKNRWARRGAY